MSKAWAAEVKAARLAEKKQESAPAVRDSDPATATAAPPAPAAPAAAAPATAAVAPAALSAQEPRGKHFGRGQLWDSWNRLEYPWVLERLRPDLRRATRQAIGLWRMLQDWKVVLIK